VFELPSSGVTILTGPPGVGKSAAAELLAARSARGVHLESDEFFRFIRSGYVPPWQPESRAQNEVVMGIAVEAARRYADGGYRTIVDGIVIPGWFLEPLRDAVQEAGHRVAYVVLRAPLPVCVERAAGRARDPLDDPAVVERLWQTFADLGELESHAIDLTGESPEETADLVASRLRDGSLVL
jgi:predicted kinase